MKNVWMFLGAIFAAILSGCAAPTEEPFNVSAEFDWCYIFNLAEENGFTIQYGTRSGYGIESDPDGKMQFDYFYDRTVLAQVLYVTVVRPYEVVGDITVRVAGNAFGIKTAGETAGIMEATLPAALDNARLEFRRVSFNELANNDYIDVQALVKDGQRIAISQIEVRGDGSNPFPYSTCNNLDPTASPTATIDLGTPFGTATSTQTPTVGPSPTTCSPDDDWGLGIIDSHSAGVWTVTSEFTGVVNRISWGHQTGWGDYLWSGYSYLSGVVTSTHIEDETGAVIQLDTDLPSQVRYFVLDSSSPFTIEFTFDYEPSSSCDPTITPTPGGPTPTPGPTSTYEPLWGACVDFTYADYLFVAEGATYVDGEGFVQDDDVWSVGRSAFGTTAKKKIKVFFAPGQSFTGDVRLTDNGSNATDWNTVSGNSFITDFSGDAWTPTNTFWLEMDGNNVPLTLQKICWLDPNPNTTTPGPGTGTPLGTWTPLAGTLTGTPGPSRTPISMPTFITTTPGVIIIPGTPFGTPPPGGGGTPGAGDGGTGSTNSGGGAGDAGEILGFAWTIGNGVFGAGSAYLGQVSDAANGLFTAYTSAPPIGIPGLPMCMSNPMAHDICAIYYILDFTIFAEGTPGALIIPFLLVIMNFYIVIRFIRWSMKLVRRTEGITDAN